MASISWKLLLTLHLLYLPPLPPDQCLNQSLLLLLQVHTTHPLLLHGRVRKLWGKIRNQSKPSVCMHDKYVLWSSKVSNLISYAAMLRSKECAPSPSSIGWAPVRGGAPGREVNPQKGHLLHLLLLECWGPPPWGHGVCVVMLECWWSRGLMYSCAVILLFGCLNLPPAFLAHASTCFGASVNCECLLALCTSLQWMDGLLVHSVCCTFVSAMEYFTLTCGGP